MLVYISGPMTNEDKFLNLRRAIDAGERIATRGHGVFIPHLNEIWSFVYPHEYEFLMKQDFIILKRCDIVVRLNGYSEGADREVGLMKQLGKPTFGSVFSDGVEEFMNSKYWCQTEPFI